MLLRNLVHLVSWSNKERDLLPRRLHDGPKGAKEALKQRLADVLGHMLPQNDAKRLPRGPKVTLSGAKR